MEDICVINIHLLGTIPSIRQHIVKVKYLNSLAAVHGSYDSRKFLDELEVLGWKNKSKSEKDVQLQRDSILFNRDLSKVPCGGLKITSKYDHHET